MTGLGARGVCVLAGLAASVMAGPASAQQVTDWSGFYAGIYAGYALDSMPGSSVTAGPGLVQGYTFLQRGEVTRIDGLVGGLAAGYAMQHGQFVLGVDGAVHAGALGKSNREDLSMRAEAGGLFDFNDIVSEDKVNLDWYSTLTGSFGVVFEQDWLLSLKGGVAIANVSHSSSSKLVIDKNVPGLIAAPAGTYQSAFASNQIVIGPVAGIAIEKMIGQNLSLGAEYAYVSLPDVSGRDADAAAMALGGGQNGRYSFPLGFHTLKASVKYHF